MANKIIADIEKSPLEIIRIEISEFKGVSYLNIRNWYKVDHEDEDFKPTKKGITIPWNKADTLIEILKRLQQQVESKEIVI